MIFNPFKKNEEPKKVVQNNQERSPIEKEFWDNENWRRFFDASDKFSLRTSEIAEKISKKNKNLDWEKCVEQGRMESFEEDKENYLKLYTERKEAEIKRREELYKNYDKIIFPENIEFLPLNKVEESIYEKSGQKKPDFENFYNKITEALKNNDISLRYFPMIDIEPKDVSVKTLEELERYKENTTSSKSMRFYSLNIKNDKLSFEEVSEHTNTGISENGARDFKKYMDLFRTTDTTKDRFIEKFGISLEEKASVICCSFPHKGDERLNTVIQLRILYDLKNPKVQEIVKNLKNHPWHMAGLLKEVSKLFPIDLYNCIKNQYSLASKVDAIELNKKYNGKPLTLELKN
ncbi:MAG: hypothetical protein WC662_01960 [Candidatus Paceibacterota bacterium]|jgi:hypothetical protein